MKTKTRFFLIVLWSGTVMARAADPAYQRALEDAVRVNPPGDYDNRAYGRRFMGPGGQTASSIDPSKYDNQPDRAPPEAVQERLVRNQLYALPKGVDYFQTAVAELQKKYPLGFGAPGMAACVQSLTDLNERLRSEGLVYFSSGELYRTRPAVMKVTKILPASEGRTTLKEGTAVTVLEAKDSYQIMVGRMTFRLQTSDIVLE